MTATEFIKQEEPIPYYLIIQEDRHLLDRMVVVRCEEYHQYKLQELTDKIDSDILAKHIIKETKKAINIPELVLGDYVTISQIISEYGKELILKKEPLKRIK